MKSIQPGPDTPVGAFALWWLRTKHFNMPIPNETVRYIGAVLGMTVYRCGQFQVEIFIMPPHCKIPAHRHPNVDSVEMGIAGSFGGRYWTERSIHKHGMTFVAPSELHAGSTAEIGASFMSMQKWLNGIVPKGIELDWTGEPMDDRHGGRLIEDAT